MSESSESVHERVLFDSLTPNKTKRPHRWMWAVIVVLPLLAGIAAGTRLAARPSAESSETAQKSAEELAPGLTRGSAAVDGVATDNIDGVPVGYPHTTDGAISAALNYRATSGVYYGIPDEDAMQIARRIWSTKEGADSDASPETLAAFREQYFGITDHGEAVDPSGRVDSRRKYMTGCQARYGAYRVSETADDRVTLEVFVPVWYGVGSEADLTDVEIDWRAVTLVMAWSAGPDGGPEDWRIEDSPHGTKMAPADTRLANPGYAALAEALPMKAGPWQVPVDSTMEALPGELFT